MTLEPALTRARASRHKKTHRKSVDNQPGGGAYGFKKSECHSFSWGSKECLVCQLRGESMPLIYEDCAAQRPRSMRTSPCP